jgi:hypothetical protein
MGIDLDELHREHPLHPRQVRLKQIAIRKSKAYWAKVRLHEFTDAFTDAQMQIGRGLLNAGGAV